MSKFIFLNKNFKLGSKGFSSKEEVLWCWF